MEKVIKNRGKWDKSGISQNALAGKAWKRKDNLQNLYIYKKVLNTIKIT